VRTMSWHAQPGIQAPVSQPARQPATIADAGAVPAACCRGTWRGSGSGCGTSAELIMMELPLIRSPVCLPASLAAGAAWRRGQPSCLLCSAKSGGGALWRVPRQAQASAARTAGGQSGAASAAASPIHAIKMHPPSQPAATLRLFAHQPGSAAARPNCPDSRKLLAPPLVCMPNSCPLQFCLLSASWWPGGRLHGGVERGKHDQKNKLAKHWGRNHARTHTRRREGAGAALPRVRPSQSCLACWRGWAYAVCGMCMCLQGGRRETQCTGNRGERTQPGLTTPSPAAPRREPRQPLPPSVSAVPRSVLLPVYCSIPLSS
jgi:hypothetical protein